MPVFCSGLERCSREFVSGPFTANGAAIVVVNARADWKVRLEHSKIFLRSVSYGESSEELHFHSVCRNGLV